MRSGLFLVVLLFSLLSYGCGGRIAYPVSHGSHFQDGLTEVEAREAFENGPKPRFIVWGNHQGAVSTISSYFLEAGIQVVERMRLQAIFEEQKIRLSHTPEDDALLFKVGNLIGATRIVFVDVYSSESTMAGAYITRYGGGARSYDAYNLSVSVRAVDVEKGVVRWSGSASFNEPITNPEPAIPYLAQLALGHAVCRTEHGYTWSDPTSFDPGGCRKSE